MDLTEQTKHFSTVYRTAKKEKTFLDKGERVKHETTQKQDSSS